MRKLLKIFDFYINSNIHVAIATASFVLITAHHFSDEMIDHSDVFVFFSTILAYQFIRVFDNCPVQKKAFINRLKKQTPRVLFISLASFIGVVYYGFIIGVSNLWVLLPATIITIWYAIPFFKINGKLNSLRNYPSIKIFSIALVWSIHTVIFPLQDQLFDSKVWLVFVQRFFLIIVLTIPFDIRDLHKDSSFIQTLPQIMGVLNAKKIGFLYLILFFALAYFKQPLLANILLSDVLVFSLSLVLLAWSSEKQSKYYASFWVESVPIIGWFSLVFFSSLLDT